MPTTHHVHHNHLIPGLGLKGVRALCGALRLNSNVTVLRLADNAIPDEGIAELVGAGGMGGLWEWWGWGQGEAGAVEGRGCVRLTGLLKMGTGGAWEGKGPGSRAAARGCQEVVPLSWRRLGVGAQG